MGRKASVCFCPSHRGDLPQTVRPKLQVTQYQFHKTHVTETFTRYFFPKSCLKNQTFSQRKSGQNLNVKFPVIFCGAKSVCSDNTNLFFYHFRMQWIIWHLNNASAGPKVTSTSSENLLLRSCHIACDCQINWFGNCSFFLHLYLYLFTFIFTFITYIVIKRKRFC